MKADSFDVIIIGAGAAGLMAAGVCAGRGRTVAVFDKNEKAGRKLRITGKGRCNVTNDCSPREVIEAATGNGKFLYGAVNSFTPQDTMAFFESRGVPLKTERGKRVFPMSDDANDIADALYAFAREKGAVFIRAAVTEIIAEGGRVAGVRANGRTYQAKSVLNACGGSSYPGTGSNGDGVRLAAKLGHTITEIRPSLVPLVEDGDICREMQGLSLKNTGLTVKDKSDKAVYHDFGELLFTHFGLSGPIALSASAHMTESAANAYTLELDLKPALDEKKLDARLLRDFEENRNRIFANSLDALLPKSMIPVVVRLSGIEPEKMCNAITKEERRRLLTLLKHFEIKIEGFRPISEAIITAGGVAVNEVNPKDMSSKLVEGLYFAGEVLDVNAYTGGFNLQIAFSTGYAAGMNM